MFTFGTGLGRGRKQARRPQLENLEGRALLTSTLPAGVGLMVSGATISGTPGTPVSATVSTFCDTDPNAQQGDFNVVVNWGDGTSSPGVINLTQPGTNPTYTVSGTHSYAAAGSYDVTVKISETRNNLITYVHSAALVKAAPAPQTVAPGVSAHTQTPITTQKHAPVVHHPVPVVRHLPRVNARPRFHK